MKTFLIFVLFFLIQQVFSQEKSEMASREKYDNYDINLKDTSLDGKWLAFYKVYDDNSDTLVIVNRNNPDKQYQKVKVQDHKWSNDRLVLKYNDHTEVFDYNKNKQWKLPACKSFGMIPKDHLLALYSSDTVKVYDLKNEQLLDKIGLVSNVFFHDDTICMQVKNGTEYDLVDLKNNGIVSLYKTPNTIFSVKFLRNHSLLIFEKKDGNIQEIVYYNGFSKKTFKFAQVLKPQFNSATGYQRNDGSIIITTEKTKVKRQSSDPEVWLTSDNNLIQKFKNTVPGQFLWQPEEKKILKLGTKNLERVVDINNDNYFLTFSFSQMQDYTTKQVSSKVYRFDQRNEEFKYVDTIKEIAFYSPGGQYIIYKKNKFWKLLNINTLQYTEIKDNSFANVYFTKNNKIIFDGSEGLWEYDIKTDHLKLSYRDEPGIYKILTYDYSGNFLNYLLEINFRSRGLNENSFMFEVYDPSTLVKSFYEKTNTKYLPLIKTTTSKLVYQKTDISKNSYVFTEENYNLPKQLITLSRSEKKKVVYQSNRGDKAQADFRIETIHYQNSEHANLKGTLHYPLNYIPSKRYPLIVHVYEIQSDKRNEYPVFLEQNITEGFDIRSLLEQGYFVYMPDIVFDKRGTGISALDCVNKSLDAISGYNSIDFDKIGMIGHSHGGYITNFVATHSNRFATYIAGSGYSDIVRSYFSMSFHYMSPLYWQYENGQFNLKTSFLEDKELYFRNNPVYYVENVSRPILLWTGKKDLNVEWGQSMEFYIGLKRNKKEATLLIYPEEGHYIASRSSSKDLFQKTMEWLGHHLKGEEKPAWTE
ncbi:alpha/beta hydrolase family protein [Chryseobacterium mucoviscidosis]|uniref:alpha/beta hydrolase family protein n=1 Tax=Chryseobacterium mucoviscidosis TaxID=1945581 RepID=UPI0031DC8562